MSARKYLTPPFKSDRKYNQLKAEEKRLKAELEHCSKQLRKLRHELECIEWLEGHDVNFLVSILGENTPRILNLFKGSKSQLRQDLFVLSELNFKRAGFFVEFGATNGVDLSNTYLLEKDFGWNGILAEPARCWHADLIQNRSCKIDQNCIWSDSNCILDFDEADLGEYSTISKYSALDMLAENRAKKTTYTVSTLSLNDLLAKHGAPFEIDYI